MIIDFKALQKTIKGSSVQKQFQEHYRDTQQVNHLINTFILQSKNSFQKIHFANTNI
jgi:hypothetical protein